MDRAPLRQPSRREPESPECQLDLFDQRLNELEKALTGIPESVRDVLSQVHASAIHIRAALEQIEVGPLLPRAVRTLCFDCGKNDMEVFHTSKRGGCHLCPTCFQTRKGRGQAQLREPLPSD
jgi:hypothetical protein